MRKRALFKTGVYILHDWPCQRGGEGGNKKYEVGWWKCKTKELKIFSIFSLSLLEKKNKIKTLTCTVGQLAEKGPTIRELVVCWVLLKLSIRMFDRKGEI